MFTIIDEIKKTVRMAPQSWKLIERTDTATQTMPWEWLQRGWQEIGSEEKGRKRPREEEIEDQIEDQIEIDHLETGEESTGDNMEQVQRRMLELYEQDPRNDN